MRFSFSNCCLVGECREVGSEERKRWALRIDFSLALSGGGSTIADTAGKLVAGGYDDGSAVFVEGQGSGHFQWISARCNKAGTGGGIDMATGYWEGGCIRRMRRL